MTYQQKKKKASKNEGTRKNLQSNFIVKKKKIMWRCSLRLLLLLVGWLSMVTKIPDHTQTHHERNTLNHIQHTPKMSLNLRARK